MINHKAEDAVCSQDDDGGGEYHLNSCNNNNEGDISSTKTNHWLSLCRRFQPQTKKLLVAVAVGLIVFAAAVTAVVKNNQRLASHAQQCPSDVDRWVYYDGAYFRYSLYLQQWPNPDPKILVLYGGGDYDDGYNDPNTFYTREGCGVGSWYVYYGNDDDEDDTISNLSLEYRISDDDPSEGGTFFINNVQYDLKNNGSVFLMELEDNKGYIGLRQQLAGLDLSSLVIDKETMSVDSVTAFCYANQDILDFWDSTRYGANNNNNARDRCARCHRCGFCWRAVAGSGSSRSSSWHYSLFLLRESFDVIEIVLKMALFAPFC